MSSRLWLAAVIVAAGAAVALVWEPLHAPRAHADWVGAPSEKRAAATGAQVFEAWERSLRLAAANVAPFVVMIEVERRADESFGEAPASWARYHDENPAYRQRPNGPVSGVLIDEAGHIVTSSFNVSGEVDRIHVTLADGRTVPGRLLGRHEPYDVGVVKIDPPGFGAPAMGPSREAVVGQFCAVVGRGTHPLRHDVTTGIVSALERQQRGLLQIDAPVNYGNTGGALVDIDGRLLGIAATIRPNVTHGLNSGVCFGVPWHVIEPALADLRAGRVVEAVREPFIGIQVDQDVVGIRGLRVAYVFPGSGADRAGLEVGDVIVEADGMTMRTLGDMRRLLNDRGIGDTLHIVYEHQGLRREAQLTLGERTR